VIFAARGLLVSLAFFATVYCFLSLLSVWVWRSLNCAHRKSGFRIALLSSANFLFGLRIFSFALSTLVAIFLAFPSFWLMERAALDEDGGTFLLAACALLVLGSGLFRAIRAQGRTRRAVTEWLSGRADLGSRIVTATLNASKGAPALILVGIWKPKVMVSDMAATVLSQPELQVAVRHELGHKRSWDNLKKMLVNATPFPGMSGLENAWREASELAADDASVANRQDALDLAAALIKLSSSSKRWLEPVLASGLVSGSSSVGVRVQRLLDWKRPRLPRRWPWAVFLCMMIGGIASNYGATLALTHRLTELLVP
jgi:Zn-dependent protease with chaperone function